MSDKHNAHLGAIAEEISPEIVRAYDLPLRLYFKSGMNFAFTTKGRQAVLQSHQSQLAPADARPESDAADRQPALVDIPLNPTMNADGTEFRKPSSATPNDACNGLQPTTDTLEPACHFPRCTDRDCRISEPHFHALGGGHFQWFGYSIHARGAGKSQ